MVIKIALPGDTLRLHFDIDVSCVDKVVITETDVENWKGYIRKYVNEKMEKRKYALL